mgnify:CR=1 FL=1
MRCKRGNPGTPMAARFSMTEMSSLIVSHTVTSMPKKQLYIERDAGPDDCTAQKIIHRRTDCDHDHIASFLSIP